MFYMHTMLWVLHNVTFIVRVQYIGLTASLARPAIPLAALVSNCDPLILVILPLQTGQFTEVYKTIVHNSRLRGSHGHDHFCPL